MSKLANSTVCQKCAKCCKEFSFIEYNRDFALRWLLLDHPKIVVEEKQLEDSKVWRITFKIKCKQLRYDPKNEKYYCTIYDGDRPLMCKDYPDNIPFLQWEIEDCSILKDYIKLMEDLT